MDSESTRESKERQENLNNDDSSKIRRQHSGRPLSENGLVDEITDIEQCDVKVINTAPQEPISELHRFLLLTLGCFGCICTGFSYTYNLISGDLQKLLDLSQIDLVNINITGQVFCYFALPFAFIYDFFGPLPIGFLCITLFPLGCVLMALTFAGIIAGSVVRLCVFYAILCIGTMMFDMSGNVTVVTYFPTMRGPVIALLKSFVGLSSSIVGAIQMGFFSTNVTNFMYFLTVYAFVVGFFIILFMRLPPYQITGWQKRRLSPEERQRREATKAQYLIQKPPMIRFLFGYILLIILIIFLVAFSACISYMGLGNADRIAFGVCSCVLTLCLWIMPFIPVRSIKRKKHQNEINDDATSLDEIPNPDEVTKPQPEGDLDSPNECNAHSGVNGEISQEVKAQRKEVVMTEEDYIAPQYQTSFFRNLLTLRLWFIVWTLFCLTGAEFVCINNSSYIYGAIAGEPTPATMRSLLSVLNGAGSAAGRLIMAAFEYVTQNRPPEKRIPMTLAPFIPCSICVLCMVFFLALPAKALPLPYVLIAIANGAQAAQTVLVPRTIYAKDPAKHYNFCFLSCVFSNIILVRFLYAEWYNRQAVKRGDEGGYCFGRGCVMMPLGVLLGLACSTVLTSLYVHFKYAHFCQKVLKERRRIKEEENRLENEPENQLSDEEEIRAA